MWHDYESSYRDALGDPSFLAWREAGARQKALNIVRVCRGMKVRSAIEIGCGTGAVLRILHSMNFAEEYACIDIAFSAVQFTRKSCQDFVPQSFVGSVDALPFRAAAFDVAILTHVVEHLDDPLAAIREASRVARFVVIEVPTEKVLSNAIRTKIFRHTYASIAGAGHVQFWNPKSIEAFLEKRCDLQILSRHLDLLSKDTEYYGKKGLDLTKPIFKETLKALLPGAVYSWLLTTHTTFLCCRPESCREIKNSSSVPLGWTS